MPPLLHQSPPPHLRGRELAVWKLVFRRGGVTAEIKRIVFTFRGSFVSHHIRAAMNRRYPGVELPSFQLHDTLDFLEERKRIICVMEDSSGKTYEVNRHPTLRIVHHDPRGKVRAVTTVSARNPKQIQFEL
jgi:hypothetical protein